MIARPHPVLRGHDACDNGAAHRRIEVT